MVNIVVADDEKLIRAGIKKILKDNLGESINIIEAKNGEEAYESVVSSKVDVVITDIRMPLLDGVGLMQKLNALEEKPSIIVLSGFDDFAYAKAAISSGALAYLLKPLDSKELIAAVNTALSVAQQAQKVKNERTINMIMNEGYSEDSYEFDVNKFPNGFCCVGICGKHCDETVFSMLTPDMYYILHQRKDFLNILISREALYLLKSDLNLSSFIVGISTPSEKIAELRRLRREAISAMIQAFFAAESSDGDMLKKKRKSGIYYFTYENVVNDFSSLDSKYERMIASIDLMNLDDVKKNVAAMFDYSDTEPCYKAESLRYIYSKIVNNLFRRYPKLSDSDTYLYLKSLMIENIHQSECLSDWIKNISDYVIYLVELLKQQQGKYPYITKALAYVDKHYSEDITMATVANYVSMNYTWFSEKFKEQVGVNFNDYLRKYRMEKAKVLLESGAYKVYEAAAKAGFKDVKHFMKTFREMNGMTAGEWSKLHNS